MTFVATVRVGTDLVDVKALARKLEADPAFRRAFLSERELEVGGARPPRVESDAGRFAAKEATVKALGEGLRLDLRDVEIRKDGQGRPALLLHGQVQECADRLGVVDTDVSISHTGGLAVAVVALVLGRH